MERETLRDYCLSRRAAALDYPFGDDVMVFKVAGKIFALAPAAGATTISLKCDPVLAVMLRETYAAVTPGYHLNKRLWNTIECDGSVPDDELLEMIDHSYEQVIKGMTKKERATLEI